MLMLTDNIEWWVRRFGPAAERGRPWPEAREQATARGTGRFDRRAAAERAERPHDAHRAGARR